MNRFLLTTIALFIITTLSFQGTALATDAETLVPDKATEELKEQMKNPKVPRNSYWDKVAQCETQGNWRDKGQWAGGLGIYRQTWVGYGGRDFAPTPDKATRLEQIVVANRIAVHGYQTKNSFKTLQDKLENKPFFRYPVGFNGWGCIRNIIGAPKPRNGK